MPTTHGSGHRAREGRSRPFSVCFVCTGNICRSPMGERVLSHLAVAANGDDGAPLIGSLDVSSAGTGRWHVGEPMDERARAALGRRGYDGDGHRARAFSVSWLDSIDLVVCLDRGHRQTLAGLARAKEGDDRHEDRLVLLRDFDVTTGADLDVPDPYYGSDTDFDTCLALVESGCRGLIEHLAARITRSTHSKARNDSFS